MLGHGFVRWVYSFGIRIIRSNTVESKSEDRGHCTVSAAEGGHGTALLFHSPACQATTGYDSEMMRIRLLVINKANSRKISLQWQWPSVASGDHMCNLCSGIVTRVTRISKNPKH